MNIWSRAIANLLIILIAWVSLFIASAPMFIIATISWLVVKPQDSEGNKINIFNHLVGVLYAQDQSINQAMCGNTDSTISGRTGYWASKGNEVSLAMEKVINLLLFWQPDHCRSAIEGDEPELYPWVF